MTKAEEPGALKGDRIRSKLWSEEPSPDNPFAAAVCRCSGYDVYGDILGKASWFEYILLLLSGERPAPARARLLERLAVAIANPGPRDASVRAAMTGACTGSVSAACLMAALGVGGGQLGGAREVFLAMGCWRSCGLDLAAWRGQLTATLSTDEPMRVWTPIEHPAGFDPHGTTCPEPVRRTLDLLASMSTGPVLPWLVEHRDALEASAGAPLAMSGVAAAAFVDLGLSEEQGEMLYLVLRLPGAMAHALEQRKVGWRRHPIFLDAVKLTNDPGAADGGGHR